MSLMKPRKCRPSVGQASIKNNLGFFAFLLLAGENLSGVAHTGQPTDFITNLLVFRDTTDREKKGRCPYGWD